MHLVVTIVTLTCLVTPSTAFIVLSSGFCPSIPPIANFDLNRYLGTWYNFENFDAPYQLGLSCVTATYDLISQGQVSVINAGYLDITIFGRRLYRRRVVARGEAIILDQSQASKLYVSFGDQPSFSLYNRPRPNYQIVATDYNTYSLVYSCTQFPFIPLKTEAAWILSRQKTVNPRKVQELKAILQGYGIAIKNFKKVDQGDC